jgi:hypothetical protein
MCACSVGVCVHDRVWVSTSLRAMVDPASQAATGPPAPKEVYLRPLRLQSGPPMWLLTAPGVGGVYGKGAQAQYGVEVIGGSASGKSAMILKLEGRSRHPVSYVELGSADPAVAECLEAVVRGGVRLTRQLGAWVRAHVHGGWSQAPSLGSVVSLNLWTSPAFAFAEANVGLGDGPRVAVGLGVDGSIHVGFPCSWRGGGARGLRGASLM